MPMQKVCPRCGATFECMHNDILQCHCASVRLSPEQHAYLKETYPDCLCHVCLTQLAAGNIPYINKSRENDKESIDSEQR